MHYYSKDFRHTKLVHAVLALIAAAIAFFVNSLLKDLDWRVVGSISFFTIFATLELVFEKYIWKLLARIPFFRLKDFSGTWEGQLLLGTAETPYPAILKVIQNWSKIIIEFSSDDAEGKSFSASVFYDRIGDQRLELAYIYYARSKNITAKNHFDHYGTAILYLGEDSSSLTGDYFTEKSRNSFGKISLSRRK